MTSKTISLKEETYRRLAQAKGEGESFSDAIDRLLDSEDGEHPLYGLVGLLDGEQIETVRQQSEQYRASLDERMGVEPD